MGLSYQVDEASLVTAAALRPSTGLTAYACVKSMESTSLSDSPVDMDTPPSTLYARMT